MLEDGICYLTFDTTPPAIEFLEFATGEVSRLAVPTKPDIWGFAVSPDGHWVLYQEVEQERDIIMVENFR